MPRIYYNYVCFAYKLAQYDMLPPVVISFTTHLPTTQAPDYLFPREKLVE